LHYYQFNIGDYTAHTARLSHYEDLAYRRLLDLYYLNERPFNECSKSVAREIGMLEQLDEVEFILNKYFMLMGGFWRNNRADKEIAAYQSKLKAASKAGKASAKARQAKASERSLNTRPTDAQPNIKHKPLNNKHKTTNKRFIPPTLNEVAKYCEERKNNITPSEFIDHYEANGWVRGKTKIKNWKACVRTWEKNDQSPISHKSVDADWLNRGNDGD